MKDGQALALHYSGGSQRRDMDRLRSERATAGAARLTPGQGLALASGLSLGLWGAIWWVISTVISLSPY
jgi:hypothetical protein